MDINKIYIENALETLKRMEPEFLDLTVTSPPYDKLRDYKGFKFPFKHIARHLYRATKWGGIVVWVVGDQVINGSETGTSFQQALFFKECGFRLHDTMIYEKAGCSMPSNNRYFQAFEYMFVFSKGKPKTTNLLKDRKNRFTERWGGGKKVRGKDGKFSERKNYKIESHGCRYNIWKYPGGAGYGTTDEIAYEHPAIFPEALAADHITSWSNEGDLVYDPFGGSGTTAKMAHLLQRRWIISEISRQYVEDIAVKRLAPYLQKQFLF